MPFTLAKLYESPLGMSREDVIEKKLDALADYLGVEFAVRKKQAMDEDVEIIKIKKGEENG